jgi:peptidoglycan hydrolase-like protein with peptidoglycan-binding domain
MVFTPAATPEQLAQKQNNTVSLTPKSTIYQPTTVQPIQQTQATQQTQTPIISVNTSTKPAIPTVSLEPNMTGSAVKQLQDYLVSIGYMTQAQVNTGYGTYGPQTKAAVTKLQSDLGIDTAGYAGYWGPKTVSVLQSKSPSVSQPTTQSQKQNVSTQSASIASSLSNTYSSLNGSTNNVQPPTENLQPGMSGNSVIQLQNWLISKGYSIPSGATGFFGNETKTALTKYQKDAGINTQGNDGYYGPITKEYIAKGSTTTPSSQSIQQTVTDAQSNSQQNTQTSIQQDQNIITDPVTGNKYIKDQNGQYVDYNGQTGQIVNQQIDQESIYKPKGTTYLVRFSSDPNGEMEGDSSTVWLVDPTTKVMLPFLNDASMQAYFKDQYQGALSAINTKTSESILQGGDLQDYILLDYTYGINESGTSKAISVSPADIQRKYGQQLSTEANTSAMAVLDGWFDLLKKNLNESGLSQSTIDTALNDKLTVANYIAALAYGGYTPTDVYMDLKKKDMISKGDTSLSNVKFIDQNLNKAEYVKTDAGYTAQVKAASNIPGRIGSLDKAIYSSTLANLPDSFYQAAFPDYLDPNSQAFKDKMDEVTSVLHDSILKQITANTESDKQFADYNWKTTRDQIEKQYGISLNDNALAAWGEVQTLLGQSSESGLSGSGIEREALMNTLRSRRTASDRARDEKERTLLTKDQEYYINNASPEEIKRLNDEDQAMGLTRDKWRSVQWGLTPLNAVTLSAFLSDFRQKYPTASNVSDTEIKAKYYDPFYDENGNMRSKLYQTQKMNEFQTIYGYNPSSLPSNIDSSLKGYQTGVVLQKGLAEIEKNEAEKTPANFFSSASGSGVDESGYYRSGILTSNEAGSNTANAQNTTPNTTSNTTPNTTATAANTGNTLTEEQRKSIVDALTNAKKTLAGIQESANNNIILPKENLQPGMSGDNVKQLQSWLIGQGYSIPSGSTGFFGDETKSALTKYQTDKGINTQGDYGYYGPITRSYIGI